MLFPVRHSFSKISRRATIRITAQLVDTSTGHHVWTDRFDEEGQDILALQDSVTEKITQSLASLDGILLSKLAPKDAWAKKRVELREYDYVQRGHALFLRWNKVDNAKAEEVFQEGLESFPSSSLLKIKVGWTQFTKATAGWSDDPDRDYQRAFELGQEALADEGAPLLTEYLGHWLLAWVYSDYHRDLDRALGEIEAAVALVPGNAMTRADLGDLQIFRASSRKV